MHDACLRVVDEGKVRLIIALLGMHGIRLEVLVEHAGCRLGFMPVILMPLSGRLTRLLFLCRLPGITYLILAHRITIIHGAMAILESPTVVAVMLSRCLAQIRRLFRCCRSGLLLIVVAV